jgi:TRAP transporter 4TM/12TM fusion protein
MAASDDETQSPSIEATLDSSNRSVDETAERAEEVAYHARHLGGGSRYGVALVAASWSVFHLAQMAVPALQTINSDYLRAIHLTFAITLAFLTFPAIKKHKTRGRWQFLSAKNRLPIIDIALAVAAAAAAIYYAVDYVGIGTRQGVPNLRDIVFGVALIVLLLEATRRALGPAMATLAGLFIAYSFLGPYLPPIVAFRGVSLERLVGQLTLSQEGIYGLPLRVSAQTVFLFVLFGAMLEKTGGGHYFVQLSFSLLGRFRGGPAKAAVLASGLTGMVSGSSIANTVTTGTFTIPLMKRGGYPAVKAAAVEVAASTNGQLMPPVMGAAAFIIAEYCNMSYLEVVRAAIVPATISYLALIYITHIEASKLGLRGLPKEDLPRFGEVFLGGIHFLIPVAALVVMLLRGFSAHRAAFYAIVMLAATVLAKGVIEGLISRRGIVPAIRNRLGQLAHSLVTGGRAMIGVAIACAAAGIIVGVVSMGLGSRITAIVETLSQGNIFLILGVTALASLALGMGLPTTATYIVMASLIAEVIVKLAGDAGFEIPRVAAHLFCFYFGILADDTPPVGLAAYAAAAIARSDPIKTGIQGFTYDLRTAVLPFMFVFNTDLLLWNITAWWHIALIFATGTLAMMAFAALTLNWFRVRNRWYESALLVVSMLVLLRPQFYGDIVGNVAVPRAMLWEPLASKFVWYAVGVTLFVGVYLCQRRRHLATAPAA